MLVPSLDPPQILSLKCWNGWNVQTLTNVGWSSNFSYCPVSWVICGKQNSDKLEKLQERALRFVFSDYTSPYNDLLNHGNFLFLSSFRIRYLAKEMYKCVHGIIWMSKDTRHNLRDSNRLQQPEFETVRYGCRSFRYYGSKLWNALPTEFKTSENLLHFKTNITQWCLSSKCDVLIIQ